MQAKFFYGVTILSWASMIALPWLWLLGSIPFNAGSIVAEIIFFILGLFSAAINTPTQVNTKP